MRARFLRLRRSAAIAVCLAILLGFAGSYAVLVSEGAAGPRQSDFVPYYSAARLIATGHGDHVFDRSALGSLERHLVRPLRIPDRVMPFLYPAYFAEALTPLAGLSYDAAFFVWLFINAVLLLLVLLWGARYLGLQGSAAVLFVVAGASFLPALLALAQGQTSILLLALFVGSFWTASRGQDALSGILLACALIKPPYVLPVVLVLLIQRRLRILVSFAVAALVLLVAPVAILGKSAITGFGETVIQAVGWSDQIGGFQPRFNQSFSGLVHLALPGSRASVVILALDVAALVLLLVFTQRAAGIERPFALAIVVGLLIGPHVLLHDLSLLLIPATVAIRSCGVLPRVANAATAPPGDAGSSSRTSLAAILIGGYIFIVAGLPLSARLHIQLSVAGMTALALWLSGGIPAIPFDPLSRVTGSGKRRGRLPSLGTAATRSINADR